MITLKNMLEEVEYKIKKSQDESYSEGYRKQLIRNAQKEIDENGYNKEFYINQETKLPCRKNKDYINPITPGKKSGVYLIGCAYSTSSQNIIYCLKIGMSSNLTQRLKNYQSTNPGAMLIDVYYTSEPYEWESHLSSNLRGISLGGFEGTSEWFYVKKEIYDLAFKEGLNFIDKYINNLLASLDI